MPSVVEMLIQLGLLLALVPLFRSTQLSSLQKGIILALFAALYGATGWYFGIGRQQQSEQATSSTSAVVEEKERVRPVLREVDFIDTDLKNDNQEVVVTTNRVRAVFATQGGIIAEFSCKRELDGKDSELVILRSRPDIEREKGAFLIALEHDTPLTYTLVTQEEGKVRGVEYPGAHSLVFRAETRRGTIEKEFVLYDDSYKIDLFVTVIPAAQEVMRPRIFVPGPFLTELSDDVAKGVIIDAKGSLEKHSLRDLEGRTWTKQELFGAEDRYFVTALLRDFDRFVERAYYNVYGARHVTAVFEGPEIRQQRTLRLEFYVGAKDAAEFNRIDPRLIGTLDYGWLRPICSLLMPVLQAIYRVVKNYGVAIIILTILLKILLLPLSLRADKTQRRMAELQRKLQALEKRHKDNPDVLEQEKAELIKKYGFSDMLLFGFVPQIVQGLVFFGINRMLSVSIDLYRAPFIGWIQNLAAPDPYHIVPVLTGIGFFLFMQRVQDVRQVVIAFMMGLIITAIMSSLAIGVVLFVCCSAWFDAVRLLLSKREA